MIVWFWFLARIESMRLGNNQLECTIGSMWIIRNVWEERLHAWGWRKFPDFEIRDKMLNFGWRVFYLLSIRRKSHPKILWACRRPCPHSRFISLRRQTSGTAFSGPRNVRHTRSNCSRPPDSAFLWTLPSNFTSLGPLQTSAVGATVVGRHRLRLRRRSLSTLQRHDRMPMLYDPASRTLAGKRWDLEILWIH